MNNQRIKPRLKWVDTAKGICILLVIFNHTAYDIMDLCPEIRDMLRATRMPLYYTIAGLFVSIKSPQIFLNKKVNRLIIPFCFFILLGNMVGYVKSVINQTDFTYFSPLYYIITGDANNKFINPPVWFLFSLFDVYLIFMLIDKISTYCGKFKTTTKIVLSLIAGYSGVICFRRGIDIPFFLDSSLSATPFLIMGHLIMSRTNLFKKDFNKYVYMSISLIMIGTALLTSKGIIDYRINFFNTSTFHIYFPGFIGVIGILMFSKVIGSIPFITKIGRYSIVYLGIHFLWINDLNLLIETYICRNNEIMTELLTFIRTVLLSMFFGQILLKTVPYLIAQKDIFYIGDIEKIEQR